jgi:hypothetical protein
MCIQIKEYEVDTNIGFKILGRTDGILHSPFKNAGCWDRDHPFVIGEFMKPEEFSYQEFIGDQQPGWHIYLENPLTDDHSTFKDAGLSSYISGKTIIANEAIEIRMVEFRGVRQTGFFGICRERLRCVVASEMKILHKIHEFKVSEFRFVHGDMMDRLHEWQRNKAA